MAQLGETKHPQVKISVSGCSMGVDEALAPHIIHLNALGYRTMFSCQGDREDQHGYICFAPGVVAQEYDRTYIELLLGITETIGIHDFTVDEEVPDNFRYWSRPWDARNIGGKHFGWSLHFRYLPGEI